MITKESVLKELSDQKQEDLYSAYAMMISFLERNPNLRHHDLFLQCKNLKEYHEKLIGIVRSFLNLQALGVFTPILECTPNILDEQYPLEQKDVAIRLNPAKFPINFYLGVYNSYISMNAVVIGLEQKATELGNKDLKAYEFIVESAKKEMLILSKRYPNHGWFRFDPVQIWVRDVEIKFALFPHEILHTPTAISWLIENDKFLEVFSHFYSLQKHSLKKTWRVKLS